MAMKPSLCFKVDRSEPVLVAPSKPTPYELKALSDLDDQKGFWRHSHGIQLCENVVGMEGKDPVQVIKQAVADTLVFFHPLAGRLREGDNGKIRVECNGEGVLFIEADAHVRLEQFARLNLPPVPGAEDLLYDVPGSAGMLNTPLVLIQVTRMLCGGFSFALRVNHMMCDAIGCFQFLTAVGEMALGAQAPSITPVWQRQLLSARNPLQVSCMHHAYYEMKRSKSIRHHDEMVLCSLFFGLEEISILRNQLQPHQRQCSNFDMLSALFWRCRTMAQSPDSDEVMRLSFAVNARTKFNPPLPMGYYGNAFVNPVALSTAGELCKNSLGYALELVKKAKREVTEEFVRSTIDFVVKNGRPQFAGGRMYTVSDLTSLTFNNIGFGYGKSVYSGTLSLDPRMTFFVPSKNMNGEEGTAATIRLPGRAMKIFIMEIEKMVKLPNNLKSSFIVSTL